MCRNHLPRQAVRLASARKALDGERRLFSRGTTDTAVYLKALRESASVPSTLVSNASLPNPHSLRYVGSGAGYYWTLARSTSSGRNQTDAPHVEIASSLRSSQ